jgi:hypothetical protein
MSLVVFRRFLRFEINGSRGVAIRRRVPFRPCCRGVDLVPGIRLCWRRVTPVSPMVTGCAVLRLPVVRRVSQKRGVGADYPTPDGVPTGSRLAARAARMRSALRPAVMPPCRRGGPPRSRRVTGTYAKGPTMPANTARRDGLPGAVGGQWAARGPSARRVSGFRRSRNVTRVIVGFVNETISSVDLAWEQFRLRPRRR